MCVHVKKISGLDITAQKVDIILVLLCLNDLPSILHAAVCLPSCVNGECIAPNNCNCTQGWMGDSCTEGSVVATCNDTISSILMSSIHAHTHTAICTSPCINGNCFQPNNCTCDQGWTGPVCSEGKMQTNRW